ncbi:MAG: cupredoxin domain-containing protein [Candidatus Dormibacteria bacterium]
MITKRLLTIPALIGITLAVAACGSGSSSNGGPATPAPAAAAATVTVIPDPATIGAFTPPAVNIKVGETVLWKFEDLNPHTVTSDTNMGSYSSQPSPKGKEYRHQFNTAGTFHYHCAIHPEMMGTVTVS